MEYEFETKTNSVLASDVPEYLKNIDRMEDALGYSLTWQNAFGPGGQVNWSMLLAGSMFGVLASVGAVAIYRLTSKAPPVIYDPLAIDRQLTGIGGWLILLAIGLIGSVFAIAINFVSTWPTYSVESWTALTTRGSESYHFLWGPYLSWVLLANITLFVLTLLTTVLFFQRRRILPRVYIGYLVFAAIVTVIDVIAEQTLPMADTKSDTARDLVRVIIACGIWIPYMLVSRRVRNTFVR
jgi:hypothetical protein